jgi:ABC-type polysaccharide/polyol phosphate transport system ATPase subunit
MLAVSCRDVEKRFHFYDHRPKSLRGAFIRLLRLDRAEQREPAFVLRRFNLSVEKGEAVALIGPNGSGKSTVLRLVAGIYDPVAGVVETRGRVAAVIDLGAGFHPELTGAENVHLYGAVMGLSRAQVRERFAEIIEFAEVEEFVDVPVKYYSSGMQARLAFAVTVCVEPDILLVDEVLAVGDQAFRERCLDRLRSFSARGGTLVVVSHDLDTISEICSRAVWLENGLVRRDGPIAEVCHEYREKR